MCKEQNVLNYYVVCNKLKNVIRTGWKDWKVKRERIESVAEHIYGVQMLAIAMKSEYQYDIDIQKVSLMLAIHELGETVIGDLTQFQISREEKERIEHEAVHKILSGLIDGEQIERIFLEFDAHKTAEAKFAYVLEVICAINKAFSKYDHISEKHIVEIAVKRMNSIYVEQRRSQAVYVRLVLNWLVIYFRGNRSSKECKEFINQFDCESKFEEILCKLMFEISNC